MSFIGNLSAETEALTRSLSESEPTQILVLGIAVLLGAASIFSLTGKKSSFPLVKLDKSPENNAKQDYLRHANALLEKGRAEHPDAPFRILTDRGEMIIIPSRLAHEIRNIKAFSFMENVKERFHPGIPGFEPFQASTKGDELIQTVTRKQLTKFLNQVTEPLSTETAYATQLRLGTSTEWRQHDLYVDMLDVVARISTRVFLGDVVCRNEEWLHITKTYTVTCFQAATSLTQKPRYLRPLLHWFDPLCTEVRNAVSKAQSIIAPVILQRQQVRRDAISRGQPVPSFNDALDWFEEEAKGNPYDPEIVQLSLSMAAIHTTTDLISETMTNIARHPELFAELREEIVQVLRADGWKKTALYKLKLLDSVIKETQRLKPVSNVSQNRIATEDVQLPSGYFIPKGTRLACDAGLRLSPEFYDNPLQFDGHRYADWRGTEKDALSHLVSTSPESMGFGHGMHACPGRFFAANEIKVALCHLLMKYDWKLVEGHNPQVRNSAFESNTDTTAKMLMRRRPEIELDLDRLSA